MVTFRIPMQLSIFDRPVRVELARTQHGGDIRRGKRKLERPVSTRRPMHVVLTSQRARGPLSLRKHERTVRDVLRRMARRFEVRIYDFANVGSHLHIVLRARRREGFWLLAGTIWSSRCRLNQARSSWRWDRRNRRGKVRAERATRRST